MVYYYHSNARLPGNAQTTGIVASLDKECKKCYNSSIEIKGVRHEVQQGQDQKTSEAPGHD